MNLWLITFIASAEAVTNHSIACTSYANGSWWTDAPDNYGFNQNNPPTNVRIFFQLVVFFVVETILTSSR